MDPRIKRLYWQLTALLLATHFAQWRWGLPLAVALNVVQLLHFAAVRRSARSLEVQVRAAYLGLLALGALPGLWPVHVVQFVGVNVMLVADYCLLARLLALMPVHRRQPLSVALLRRVLLLPPAPGAITSRL